MSRDITLIAAVAQNGVIGRDGGLVFHLPGDLPRFKELTMGKPVVMGRKTWDSLRVKPLPGRLNIVLTRDKTWEAEGAVVARDVTAALRAAGDASEVMVMGGGEIYSLFMPVATRLELTEVHACAEGDVVFPEYKGSGWREVAREVNVGPPPYDYVRYELTR
ncbi:MAG: dihydrofolate reductase [Pseudomonadaceae bacterium]|nr:dihydrofolate reductase [Pseudomonadaceae bacterium]